MVIKPVLGMMQGDYVKDFLTQNKAHCEYGYF